MNRSLALLAIGLLLGGLAGFVLAAGNGITLDGQEHGPGHAADPSQAAHAQRDSVGAAGHSAHETLLSLPADAAAPTLEVAVERDPVAGWNLHVVTTGFAFAPQQVGRAHVAGEGHAHVYVNGAKIARLYGPWLHIADLPAGETVIAVTLNANDHRPLAVGTVPLRAETTVAVR